MRKRNQSISICFPAYNDGKTIEKLVFDALSVLESITDDCEVIIVNDGSKDNTEKTCDKLTEYNTRIRVIHHTKNKGYGYSLRTGFINATKDLIFYTDGDGQYDVKELPLLLSLMREGVDMVNGYKIYRSDPFYRIITGKIYNWIVKMVFGLRIKDISCDFRLFRRSVLDKIKLDSNSGAICVEMMKKIQDAGFSIVEAPVHHYPRRYGHSQFFTFSNLFKMLLELFKL